MKCPLCGKGTLVAAVRDETYEYRGRTATIPVAGDYCTHCGEGISTTDQTDAYLAEARQFRARVDAEPLAPSEIRRIRKRLGMTQKEAGEFFGGGIRAFSQYERGETRPLKSTDKLLRLLDRHPELLAELRDKKAA